ncbi:MAG: glycosyltransferase family 2 protein, partial [bacterium]|nr:glycosyltransferase family 2 protein [bacterium]
MNERKPLVSVVMPVHNAQKYIGSAIESILNQTLKDLELIIVNDCSTDKTLDIIISFSKRDARIKILNNKMRLDIAASLNKGIRTAQSNIIARMDSDDISLTNRLILQYELINSSKDIVAVGSDIIIINSTGDEIGLRKYPNSSTELKNCLFKYSPFAHPVVMFRKDVFEEVGG